MINYKPKSLLILQFLVSFLLNSAYEYIDNGPTYDMYNCIAHNINSGQIKSEQKYNIEEVKILVNIGSSETNTKYINLYFFPDDIKYRIKLIANPFKDKFNFMIKNNILRIQRIDNNTGWGYNHLIYICIESKETIFLFPENRGLTDTNIDSYVTLNNEKILDSRDMTYYNNKGW